MKLSFNIYSQKTLWKIGLLLFALFISISSLIVTDSLVSHLEREERKKIELWAEATKQLASFENLNQDVSNVLLMVIKDNETIPVLITDQNDSIFFSRNIDTLKAKNHDYLKSLLKEMKRGYPPIEIKLSENKTQYFYYEDSILLIQLHYYPYIQLTVFFLFILIAYLAFSSIRRSEQNQVWMGMAKETAHQLGTPISSLMAWLELLKQNPPNDNAIIPEIENDIKRLELVAKRFSKIGSVSKPELCNIVEVVQHVTQYMKTRSSSQIMFNLHVDTSAEILVPLIVPLFEWVLENLYKNAIDAMDGNGSIDIFLSDQAQFINLDIKDSGKGIPKSKFKTVFKPGYTTKKRGWGLGLSLTKRIVEEYHKGKIFVKTSEINQGTTFRIILSK
jgi:signal transduction histidine kinase